MRKPMGASRYSAVGASWRRGYAEDCKSLHAGSIPAEASIQNHHKIKPLRMVFCAVIGWICGI